MEPPRQADAVRGGHHATLDARDLALFAVRSRRFNERVRACEKETILTLLCSLSLSDWLSRGK